MWLDDTTTDATTTDSTDTTDSGDTTTTPTLDNLTPQQKMNTLLTVDSFKTARPNMVSFTDQEIQECINTSMDMLDALCGGLISQVCGYNVVDDRTTLDTTNSLYRTDFQMSQLTRAFIIQTQYTLNLGNDFSIGSSSMSTGGLNGAFQRPADRDIYAPGVKEALRLAGVYVYQAFGLNTQANQNLVNVNDLLTRETADNRYVQTYQKNGAVGSIAQIDSNLMVSFVDPSSVSFNITQAQTILDPQNNTYQPIDKVSNIAWISGANKNVDTPQEVDTKIQDAINNVPQLTYISFYAGEILAFATDNDYQQFKNETGTTDDDFRNLYVDGSTWIYKSLGSNIESTAMYLLDLDKVPEFVDLKNQVNTNTTNITNLQTQQDTNTANIATNTTNITNNTNAITAIQNDYVTTDTQQLITATKTLNNGFQLQHTKNWAPIIKFLETDNSVVAMLGYTTFSDMTASNNKFTLQGPALFEMVNADIDGTGFTDNCLVPKKYVDNQIATIPTIDWSNIQASSVNFPNATNINVANGYTPINDNSLATKSYVDNKVELKYFTTTIATTTTFIATSNGDPIVTVITFTDSTYNDRDLAFIEDTLASEAKPRRHTILQIGTDNSVAYIGGPTNDGALNVGATIKVYYYD